VIVRAVEKEDEDGLLRRHGGTEARGERFERAEAKAVGVREKGK